MSSLDVHALAQLDKTPLRVCGKCGLEAWTVEDLHTFVKHKTATYGRDNCCKKCNNESTREYRKNNPLKIRYNGIVQRCYNPNASNYHYYGGRGIYVVDEWRNDRQAFIDWGMKNGFKPELQIDRIDNDGPYSPENCRWVIREQQQRNTRFNTTIRFLEYLNDNGDGFAAEVSDALDISHNNASMRMLTYHRWGLLRRTRVKKQGYLYTLTAHGVNRLEYLRNVQ